MLDVMLDDARHDARRDDRHPASASLTRSLLSQHHSAAGDKSRVPLRGIALRRPFRAALDFVAFLRRLKMALQRREREKVA